MPNYLHRTTKQYYHSLSPSELPEVEANYIVQPDLSAVVGQPNRYWKITGDVVSLMDAGEQATVDAAITAAAITGNQNTLKTTVDETSDVLEAVDIRALIQNSNKRINFLTTRVIELQNIITAMLESTGQVASMRTAGLAQVGVDTQTAEAAALLLNTATRALPAAITAYKAEVDEAEVSG